jgi:hypothetical protein
MGRGKIILVVIYLVLALYFINGALNFISLPEFFLKIDKWILFAGGIFLILGAINSWKLKRYS